MRVIVREVHYVFVKSVTFARHLVADMLNIGVCINHIVFTLCRVTDRVFSLRASEPERIANEETVLRVEDVR